MKNIFSLILFLSCVFCFAQENTTSKQEVIESNNEVTENKSIEIKPEPIEGFQAFYRKLSATILVPESDLNGTYRTLVSFIVDKDGTLTDFKVVKETPKVIGLGEEVIRVLKKFPKWKPGNARIPYILPVTTVIENEIEPVAPPVKE